MNLRQGTLWRAGAVLGITCVGVFGALACNSPVESQTELMHPQSLVLLVTPKIFPDFDHPDSIVSRFFGNYEPLTSRSSEVIVIFAVGNSDHILQYRGINAGNENIEWARTTDFVPVSDQTLNYSQIKRIVLAFRQGARAAGVNLKVYDQIDSSGEFTISNIFKYQLHQECTINQWRMFDVRARLQADSVAYATRPNGIAEGTLCGSFLVDQAAQYMSDIGFDGMLYGNQLGTRGRWFPGDGPGYTVSEANGINEFLSYSKRVFGDKGLIWFDSYNDVREEHDTFSFPSDGYQYLDYLLVSGFCVITDSERYERALKSKLRLPNRRRLLATLDYVDPWYTYNSMTDYKEESRRLEDIAVDYRLKIDGLFFFANDEKGAFVPRTIVDAVSKRFYAR